ncbi:DUF6781 family protein [Sulfuricurvum sp.]|uniref:DUF6781 family protein n=1 Tax=Sulfuricurvum sp. TaxID=2025608 RepID=UPI002E340150|nr:DUF6781 family protein [Sulfuricurvum sp.]HEX5328888.1 DUF6781 family protein [Sulfuricurvum sp.]
MNLETFKRDIKNRYHSLTTAEIDTKVSEMIDTLASEWATSPHALSLQELRIFTGAMIEEEGHALYGELEDLIAQKERIERQITRKSEELQHLKYNLYNALEKQLSDNDETLEKLHQVKLQSIDLLEILEEITESAIITTLEKGSDAEDTLKEIIKEITFTALNANVLNAVRIRRILASILQNALNIAEASPNQAETILRGTLHGINNALLRSIEKFHQYLLYVPEEVKALYRDEYKTIEVELDNVDTLYTQIIHGLHANNDPVLVAQLESINHELSSGSDELKHLSKETVELLRTRLAKIKKGVTERGNKLLKSKSAQEAKAMGTRAWSVAKSTMQGAIKGAKEAMEKDKK